MLTQAATTFAGQRKQIANVVTAAGVQTFTRRTKKLLPPGAFVGPGDPYITRTDASFGGEIVRHRVTVAATLADDEAGSENLDLLDDVVLTVLDALYSLEPLGYDVGDMRRPGTFGINGQAYLGSYVDLDLAVDRARD